MFSALIDIRRMLEVHVYVKTCLGLTVDIKQDRLRIDARAGGLEGSISARWGRSR